MCNDEFLLGRVSIRRMVGVSVGLFIASKRLMFCIVMVEAEKKGVTECRGLGGMYSNRKKEGHLYKFQQEFDW